MDARYHNRGKLLKQVFPEQTRSNWGILLWTVIYLLNLAAVLLVQYHLIYTFPTQRAPGDKTTIQLLQEKKRFEGYEFLDISQTLKHVHVLCRNEDGEKVIVSLKEHDFFPRRRLTFGEKSVTDGKRIDMDGLLGSSYVTVEGDAFTDRGGTTLGLSNKTAMIPVLLLTLVPFCVEVLIYNRIRALLR